MDYRETARMIAIEEGVDPDRKTSIHNVLISGVKPATSL